MATKPRTIDEYLTGVPEDARTVLEGLRKTIRSAAPDATETISYGIPTYEQDGHLVAYAAFKNHLSFFPMNSTLVDAYKEELAPYKTSKGTIQFTVERPLPAKLVRRIVKERAAENRAKRR